MKIKQIPAKSVSYGGTRSLSAVAGIVIHYTAGTKDTAENQGNYFANGNTRTAGAHFFVDQNGDVVQSIAMERIAWAVGGAKYSNCATSGGGKLYGIMNNSNTVSIELCAIADKEPSDKQVAATRELIAYIKSKCPRAQTLCRHFDINGKPCPATMTTAAAWQKFLNRLNGAQTATETASNTASKETDGYKIKVTADVLNVRKTASAKSEKVGSVKKGEVYTIVKKKSGWGKLKSGLGWIYLKYTKEV